MRRWPLILIILLAEPLPSFRDVLSQQDKQTLFIRKLHLCAFTFDFTDAVAQLREKEMKRQTLLEMVDYVNSGAGKFTEAVSVHGCVYMYVCRGESDILRSSSPRFTAAFPQHCYCVMHCHQTTIDCYSGSVNCLLSLLQVSEDIIFMLSSNLFRSLPASHTPHGEVRRLQP